MSKTESLLEKIFIENNIPYQREYSFYDLKNLVRNPTGFRRWDGQHLIRNRLWNEPYANVNVFSRKLVSESLIEIN